MPTLNPNPTNTSTQNPISVWYFASLAEQAHCDEETLLIDTPIDLASLYAQVQAKHGFDLPQHRLAVALNHDICEWSAPVQAGDIVAFIPPVAGG